MIQEVKLAEDQVIVEWRKRRPLPEESDFFENVWKQYRENEKYILIGGFHMAAIWNGNVLLDTIIQNEEKSVELYQYIASTLKDEDQKELFISLSNDEERHAKIYNAIKRKFSESSEIKIAEEDMDYLELMILNNIFSNGKDHMAEIKKLLATMNPYDLAEKLERDAILYVLELQDLYPNLAPDEISIILKEERKHLRLVFTKKLDKLRK